jgi:hypothetical protein
MRLKRYWTKVQLPFNANEINTPFSHYELRTVVCSSTNACLIFAMAQRRARQADLEDDVNDFEQPRAARDTSRQGSGGPDRDGGDVHGSGFGFAP